MSATFSRRAMNEERKRKNEERRRRAREEVENDELGRRMRAVIAYHEAKLEEERLERERRAQRGWRFWRFRRAS
jgi:hypothetical protein